MCGQKTMMCFQHENTIFKLVRCSQVGQTVPNLILYVTVLTMPFCVSRFSCFSKFCVSREFNFFYPLGWQTLKLEITHVWLLDFYGPATMVPVKDYFKVKL